MKTLICMCLFGAVLAAADQPATKTNTAPVKPPAKKFTPLTVPPDATPLDMGRYRWTDKDGQVWIYHKTPFGVHREPENGPNTGDKPVMDNTTAVAQGDSIKFTRETPFGKYSWVRKKTELNETEQKVWAAHKMEKE